MAQLRIVDYMLWEVLQTSMIQTISEEVAAVELPMLKRTLRLWIWIQKTLKISTKLIER